MSNLIWPLACLAWCLDLPPPSVVGIRVDCMGVVDVMAGEFCVVDDEKPAWYRCIMYT